MAPLCERLERLLPSGSWIGVTLRVDGATAVLREGATVERLTLGAVALTEDPRGFVLRPVTSPAVSLRAPNPQDAAAWFQTLQGLLRQLSPRSDTADSTPAPPGAPVTERRTGLMLDPRMDLELVPIPDEFESRFEGLRHSVLYWFDPCTMLVPGTLMGHRAKPSVAILTETALILTKPDSSVRRCVKLHLINGVFTSVGLPGGQGSEAPFVLLKAVDPEYDLCLQSHRLESFLEVLTRLHTHCSKHQHTLAVTYVPQLKDCPVVPRLAAPPNYAMTVVVPPTRAQLRRALVRREAQSGWSSSPKMTLRSPPAEVEDLHNSTWAGRPTSPSELGPEDDPDEFFAAVAARRNAPLTPRGTELLGRGSPLSFAPRSSLRRPPQLRIAGPRKRVTFEIDTSDL